MSSQLSRLEIRDVVEWTGDKGQSVFQWGCERVRVSGSKFDRPEAQSVVSLLCVGDCRQCRDAMRYGAMLILARTAAAHYFDWFQRDCRVVAGSRNDLTDWGDARSWACPRSSLRWEPMKTCPRFSRSNGVVGWVDEWSEAACELAV